MKHLYLICFVLAACSSPVATSSAPTPTAPATPSAGSEMFRLQTRNGSIGVHATGHGPSFSVHSADGALLARDLDEAGLATRFPELYESYGRSVAHADAKLYKSDIKARPDGRIWAD
jgi:hypothetical protein